MQVTLRIPDTSSITLSAEPTDTILSLKKQLVDANKAKSVEQVRLVSHGRILMDDRTINDETKEENPTFHVIVYSETPEHKPMKNEVTPSEATEIVNDPRFIELLRNRKFLNMIKEYMADPSLLNVDTKINAYESQIMQLVNMGFESEKCLMILKQTGGNVDNAVNLLLMETEAN